MTAPSLIATTALFPHKVEGMRYLAHFQKLEREGFLRVRYREYALVKQTWMILRGRERSPLHRVARNVVEIPRLLAGPRRLVVLAAAAFDWSVLFANQLKRKHHCIFYTSWPYWDPASLDRLPLAPWRQRAWRRFLKGTTCVTVTPHPTSALEAYGAESLCIPYPVDTEVFRPADDGARVGPKRVLFVGRLLDCKGISVLLEAIASRTWRDVRFTFLGDGPLRREILAHAANGQPVDYVGHHTESEALLRHYQAADLFVLPSITTARDEEKFGLVLLEALACGLPIVTTDCIGPRQIVRDGHTGFVVPQNDPEALACAIGMLVDNEDLRRRFAHNARLCAVEAYGLAAITGQWRNLILRVEGRGRA
jgi:glycosyltransferase involved in cell wall biosynthesis